MTFNISFSEDYSDFFKNFIENEAKENNKKNVETYLLPYIVYETEPEVEEPLLIENKEVEFVKLSYILSGYDLVVDSENENNRHDLGSLTKVMTAIVTLDAIKNGEISLDDVIYFNEEDLKIGGSGVKASLNIPHTLKELLDVSLVYSANNATNAIARYVGNNNLDSFIQRMNKKAQEIGMFDTMYYTPMGLPTSYTKKPNDYSTASDQLKLVKYILDNYPELLKIVKQPEVIFDNRIYESRNALIDTDDNIGLKTGFHKKAGYNMIGLYKKGNIYSVVITLGNKSTEDRFNTQVELYKNISNKILEIVNKEKFSYEVNLKDFNKTLKTHINENYYALESDNVYYTINLFDISDVKKISENEIVGTLNIYIKNLYNTNVVHLNLYSNYEIYKTNLNVYILSGSIFLILVFIFLIAFLKKRKMK